jgi:hypothetical protein
MGKRPSRPPQFVLALAHLGTLGPAAALRFPQPTPTACGLASPTHLPQPCGILPSRPWHTAHSCAPVSPACSTSGGPAAHPASRARRSLSLARPSARAPPPRPAFAAYPRASLARPAPQTLAPLPGQPAQCATPSRALPQTLPRLCMRACAQAQTLRRQPCPWPCLAGLPAPQRAMPHAAQCMLSSQAAAMSLAPHVTSIPSL